MTFEHAASTRTGAKHDNCGIESAGFEFPGAYAGPMDDYLDWRARVWLESGICPDSGFYIATKSEWLESLNPEGGSLSRHYVVSGRDGYVELLALSFAWKEWLWTKPRRDDNRLDADVVGSGKGVD